MNGTNGECTRMTTKNGIKGKTDMLRLYETHLFGQGMIGAIVEIVCGRT